MKDPIKPRRKPIHLGKVAKQIQKFLASEYKRHLSESIKRGLKSPEQQWKTMICNVN